MAILQRVLNNTKVTLLGDRIALAVSFWARAKGLLGKVALQEGEGLIISPCSAVHTFFMRYPIDILFLDAQNRVLKAQTLAPWRISAWVPGAARVLELPSGVLRKTTTTVGDALRIENAH